MLSGMSGDGGGGGVFGGVGGGGCYLLRYCRRKKYVYRQNRGGTIDLVFRNMTCFVAELPSIRVNF